MITDIYRYYYHDRHAREAKTLTARSQELALTSALEALTPQLSVTRTGQVDGSHRRSTKNIQET